MKIYDYNGKKNICGQRVYMYTIFARTGNLLSEYIVEK